MIFFIGILVAAILFSIVIKVPLKRAPWLFYLVALAMGALVMLTFNMNFPHALQTYVLQPLQRCHFAFALFAVVMFIGVFDDRSKVKTYLLPVRAELSILACIFALPHIARNIISFIPNIYINAASTPLAVYVSSILALLLSALMLLLGVTSFKKIKENMRTATWKKVQLLAYPFFIGTYLHIALLLLYPAMSGGRDALEHLIIYTLIVVLYSVLRVKKVLTDRRSKQISHGSLNADSTKPAVIASAKAE